MSVASVVTDACCGCLLRLTFIATDTTDTCLYHVNVLCVWMWCHVVIDACCSVSMYVCRVAVNNCNAYTCI